MVSRGHRLLDVRLEALGVRVLGVKWCMYYALMALTSVRARVPPVSSNPRRLDLSVGLTIISPREAQTESLSKRR